MEKTSDFREMFDRVTPEGEAVTAREELEAELTRLHRKDRRNMFIIGLLSALMIAAGTMMYVTGQADSATSLDSGYAYSGSGVYYADYSGYSGQGGGVGTTLSGGGCGLAGGGGGCCGGGGSALGNVSLADLEKKAAEQYTKETGKSDIKAKANNYGCHIQIDIYDAKGNVVRSYGYRGGPLYVIQ